MRVLVLVVALGLSAPLLQPALARQPDYAGLEAELDKLDALSASELVSVIACWKSFDALQKKRPAPDAPPPAWPQFAKSIEDWARECLASGVSPWVVMARMLAELEKRLPSPPPGAGAANPAVRLRERHKRVAGRIADGTGRYDRMHAEWQRIWEEIRKRPRDDRGGR